MNQSKDQLLESSPLYSEELAPVPLVKRNWNTLHMAALWVGMAVCIPTWVLASYMLKAGLNWKEALLIIGLANIVITLPMVLNGMAGVKYGLSFPVIGRAAFGVYGVHLPALMRALVACGWFGVQTWIGGLAVSAILGTLLGMPYSNGLTPLNFIGFGLFWLISMYFVVKGFEGIKWLEEYSAPLLILVGLALIGWGIYAGGGVASVLDKSNQLQHPSAVRVTENNEDWIQFSPLEIPGSDKSKATHVEISIGSPDSPPIETMNLSERRALRTGELRQEYFVYPPESEILNDYSNETVFLRFVALNSLGETVYQSQQVVLEPIKESLPINPWVNYLIWFTAMVGFWATMAISISDITRFASNQKAQIAGQFLGLPATMLLFSFIGMFVTSAAIVSFDAILIQEDAPWDPVALLSNFTSPWVVVATQLVLLLATLSTNLAANVIAPATAFSNLFPKYISFRSGGIITGIIGIAICPWWLLGEISNILLAVSAFLGPVLGILLSDYFIIRRGKLNVRELYNPAGEYAFGGSGINAKAMLALILGVVAALTGYVYAPLEIFFDLAWFTGFTVSFISYGLFSYSRKTPI